VAARVAGAAGVVGASGLSFSPLRPSGCGELLAEWALAMEGANSTPQATAETRSALVFIEFPHLTRIGRQRAGRSRA
jgi:hypothetical protein